MLDALGSEGQGAIQVLRSVDVEKAQEFWVQSGNILFRKVSDSHLVIEAGYLQVSGYQPRLYEGQARLRV